MRRRDFMVHSLTVLGTAALPIDPAIGAPGRTRWAVQSSVGFDAIAFLGPLAGEPLYTQFYAEDVAAFGPRLTDAVRTDIARLWKEASDAGVGLLGPTLAVLFSTNGNDRSIDTLLRALAERFDRILPTYRESRHWSARDWSWFNTIEPRLTIIFTALRDANFERFREERIGGLLPARIEELQRALTNFDVVTLQEKLTGRSFDPDIDVVLLRFSKPHGIKVQGPKFLQALDYDTATTVRIAAHEMLHPPVAMNGPAARDMIETLSRDPLLTKIVRDHDPRWGYQSLAGLMDEDLVQALDQLICEALGVARVPSDRWRRSDDGMHVLAAAFYGLLLEDRWIVGGGSIEAWLADVAQRGRLAPMELRRVAAGVLRRDPERLWPIAAGAQ